jgi:hypothetical protein
MSRQSAGSPMSTLCSGPRRVTHHLTASARRSHDHRPPAPRTAAGAPMSRMAALRHASHLLARLAALRVDDCDDARRRGHPDVSEIRAKFQSPGRSARPVGRITSPGRLRTLTRREAVVTHPNAGDACYIRLAQVATTRTVSNRETQKSSNVAHQGMGISYAKCGWQTFLGRSLAICSLVGRAT